MKGTRQERLMAIRILLKDSKNGLTLITLGRYLKTPFKTVKRDLRKLQKEKIVNYRRLDKTYILTELEKSIETVEKPKRDKQWETEKKEMIIKGLDEMKNFIRYRAEEIAPYFGIRMLGRVNGYSTKTELLEDLKDLIKDRKDKGVPVFITREEVEEQVV